MKTCHRALEVATSIVTYTTLMDITRKAWQWEFLGDVHLHHGVYLVISWHIYT
jgi:hypothetical protein